MTQPDYQKVEALLRNALDDLRNAVVLMTKGETNGPLSHSLGEAAGSLRELDDLFDRDPLAAHAAGRIFVNVLLERVEAMTCLVRAAAGTELPPEQLSALVRLPDGRPARQPRG